MDSEFQPHHIALKTLRQRCVYLQQKLEAVEEENCQLKLQKVQQPTNEVCKTSSGSSYLQDQIVLLNKQNSQLSHRIQMIIAENQTLWSQLSKLILGNEGLGPKLAVSVNYEDLKLAQPVNSLHLDPSGNMSVDLNSKESLEEISLKLINSIIMGKTELENQYSQMIDLHKGNNTSGIGNSSVYSLQFDTRTMTNNLKSYMQKLKDFKQALCFQKNDLTNAISNIKNLQKTYICNKCSNNLFHSDAVNGNNIKSNTGESESDLSTQNTGASLNGDGTSSSDMICPMCGKAFTGQFTNFYQHVSDHFDDENEPYVGDEVSFDIVP